MKLIIGLGNPGSKYAQTRHNIGHRIVDELKTLDSDVKSVKTTVFMNASGLEVKKLVNFYKISPNNLLIVHDDMDLPFGEMRLQFARSSAGHHGIDSVIDELGTNEFWRLRAGIGDRGGMPGDQFVIERFSEVEEKELPRIIKEATGLVKHWLKERS